MSGMVRSEVNPHETAHPVPQIRRGSKHQPHRFTPAACSTKGFVQDTGNMKSHQLNVSDPWFGAIKRGEKTVEGRLASGRFLEMKEGTPLTINRSKQEAENESVYAVVTRVVHYNSIKTYLEQEGLARTLPGVKRIADGVAIYRQFYSTEKEKTHGIAAIHIRVQ